MPRKPTLLARQAREGLLELVRRLPKDTYLPALGELAGSFQLHPSTIFRLLRDLATEGLVWQSPSGKFFAVSSQRKALRKAPICFVGREMWQWSRLYQEILEGISEVCSANGSPLILLSSRGLVSQQTASAAPEFASPRAQAAELPKLAGALPRGIAGIIFDHVWCEKALEKVRWPGGQRVQLLHGTGKHADVIAPDYADGAAMAATYIREKKFRKIALIIPFQGDPAIDAAVVALREALAPFSPGEIPYAELASDAERFNEITRASQLIICPEDNIAETLAERLRALSGTRKPILFGTQGTGVLHAPSVRLRIDFRRLGRAAASRILHGTESVPARPLMIHSEESTP